MFEEHADELLVIDIPIAVNVGLALFLFDKLDQN